MSPPIHFVVRIHQANLTFPQLLAVWRAADRLGYDGATLYDLLAAPCLECWTTLTALTALTRRLRPIPLVLAHPYRNPVVLAKMAATLDVISGGRLVLGLGAGGDRPDHEASGLVWDPLPERVARLEDGVRLVRFLWSEEPVPSRAAGRVRAGVAFSSRFYGTVTGPGFPRPIQRPGPPILIGGHGERYLLRAVARVADLCNIGFDLSPDEWRTKRELLTRYCREEGREPLTLDFTHNATVMLTTAGGRASVQRFSRVRPLGSGAGQQVPPHALIGTPDECIARLHEYIALGVTWFFLLFPDLPDLAGLRRFARTVLPALRF